eukprot:3293216-Pyramimonas_sp.AAC.1
MEVEKEAERRQNKRIIPESAERSRRGRRRRRSNGRRGEGPCSSFTVAFGMTRLQELRRRSVGAVPRLLVGSEEDGQ